MKRTLLFLLLLPLACGGEADRDNEQPSVEPRTCSICVPTDSCSSCAVELCYCEDGADGHTYTYRSPSGAFHDFEAEDSDAAFEAASAECGACGP